MTGFRAIELLSYEYIASEETKNKWFDLLRVNLADTIATGKFVVGVGNTDWHSWMEFYETYPGNRGFSWVYTQDYQYYLRSSIWNAIRSGHVSASGRKDLGVFAVNGTVQGSVIKVSAQGQLQFKLVQQPVTGRRCTMVRIVDAWRNPIRNIANPGTETYVTLPPPPNDTFYVVKFEFTATDGSEPSDVWCNPIFIDRI
ncbi:MAG: hypothetical protein H5U02_14745 [Clostridia bacterium]|nr:hypothetical protein [Clostridia bacterium]